MDATPKETWLPVVGWEGLYEVSDLGRVRSLDRFVASRDGSRKPHKGRILTGSINRSTGYRTATLVDASSGRRHYALIHRLVLEAFVGPCPDGMECCHSDLDRSNEALSNLRWDTRSANTLDAVRHKTNHNAKKNRCPNGHEYDLIESRGDRRPVRACKQCKEDARRERTGQRERSDTHCLRGHEFSEKVMADGRSKKICLTCRRDRDRRYRQRRKSADKKAA